MTILSDIQTLAGVVSPLTGKALPKDWRASIRDASWRGVPFVTIGGQIKVGRRNAIHEYPLRDTVWVEDLGRSARRISVSGFYVGDDVVSWRERMIAACEAPGDGQLVHATLGVLTVSLIDTALDERWDKGRVCAVNFTFIEAGARVFPNNVPVTKDDVSGKSDGVDSAASADFVTKVSASLTQGAAVVNQAVTSAASWARTAQALANDATNLTKMVKDLPGTFGRYAKGANTFSGLTSGVQGGALTIQNLIASGSVARTNVGTAASKLAEAAPGIGL